MIRNKSVWLGMGLALLVFAAGCNSTGLNEEQLDQAKRLAALGVKIPDSSNLSEQEEQIFKLLLSSSVKISKEFVSKLGKKAENEKRFAKILEQFEKKPIRALVNAGRQEDSNKVWIVKPGKVPTRGPEDAPITIVEFSDFQCTFCSRGYKSMKEIEEKYGDKVKIQFVSKILPFHKKAPLAHAAAYAAWEQDKFWEFHDIVFENQKELSETSYLEWAKKLGLNMDKFKADMKVEKYQEEFDRMDKVASELGVRGTPTFFINGKKLRGAKPTSAFIQVIDEILAGK